MHASSGKITVQGLSFDVGVSVCKFKYSTVYVCVTGEITSEVTAEVTAQVTPTGPTELLRSSHVAHAWKCSGWRGCGIGCSEAVPELYTCPLSLCVTRKAACLQRPGMATNDTKHGTCSLVQWSEDVIKAHPFFGRSRARFRVPPWVSNTIARDHLA